MLTLFFSISVGGCDKNGETQNPIIVDDDDVEVKMPLAEIPSVRLERLKKGINLAHWFSQQKSGNLTKSYINNRFTNADFEFIKNSGFSYVRLPVDERIVFLEPNLLKTEYLLELDEYINKFIDNGVAVLFDFHPTDGFKDKVHSTPSFANDVRIFWGKLAKYLDKFDPDFLYIEVMNEPWAETAQAWNETQKTWVHEIRKNAPQHTIIVDGNLRITKNNWDDVAALISIDPFAEKNIIYNFHYYQPFAFTHQAATWGWEVVQHLSGLIYPMDEQNCLYIKNSNLDKPTVGWAMDDYINQNWRKQRLESALKPAFDWAKQHNVYVTVNEFGAYYTSEGYGRYKYIKDMREVLEEYNFGWALWEYDDGFGAINNNSGIISFSNEMKEALGL